MNDERLAALRAFVAEWRAHDASQAGQRTWMRWATATLVGLAVGGALASLKYTTYSNGTIARLNESAVRQSESSSAWQDHEVLRVRAFLYALHAERLELDLLGAQRSGRPEILAEMRAHVEKYRRLAAEHAAGRDRQLVVAKAIEADSDRLMHAADEAEKHVNDYALCITLFQIGVAFASLSLISRRRWPWFASLALAGIGILQALNANFLWLG